MSLNLNALEQVRFATLDFPFAEALERFLKELKAQYKAKHKRDLEHNKKPPYRQLSQAIMACCPVLVHAFEKYNDVYRMVAVNRLARDPKNDEIVDAGYQFPDRDSLIDLIGLWIDHWLENADLKKFVDETMSSELQTLKDALKAPETDWEKDVSLHDLIKELDQDDTPGYNAIPAVIMALLHGQTVTLQHGGQPLNITWRKAHNGLKKGLHLVSQPIHASYVRENRWRPNFDENDEVEVIEHGYFVYRLEAGLETQVGRLEGGKLKPWIFLKVGMRRYPHEAFKKDKFRERNLSILLGFNREKILPENRDKFNRYPYDTTLIALPVDMRKREWDGNLAPLLSSYGLSALDEPQDILDEPAKYGNLDNNPDFKGNEYYVIHAEGRKYSDDEDGRSGHGHPVNPGLSLKEQTEVIQRVLELLPDILIPDVAFEPDIEAPKGSKVPLALRNYEFFALKPSETPEKRAEKVAHTVEAIRRAIESAGKSCLDIALIHHDTHFLGAVKAKIRTMLPDLEAGDEPFLYLHEVNVSPLFLQALDPGDLDPNDHFNKNRAEDFYEKWAEQMKNSRHQKVEEQWRPTLHNIPWRPHAHRTTLIESYYDEKGFKAIHESQKIKGAVREACSKENIHSQFIGHFKVTEGKKLSYQNDGILENAILDLLLRGTATLYGTPAEMYDEAAGLLPLRAPNLDVVAFWHVQKPTDLRSDGALLTAVIAVRLHADGRTEVFAPGLDNWIPYVQAGHVLGTQFATLRSKIHSKQDDKNYLRMNNKAIMRFVHDVLQNRLDKPTIAVVPANWWRYSRSNEYDIARWSQLANKRLFNMRDVLDFSHVPGVGKEFTRDDPHFGNLLAVIRLRKDSETPSYTTGTHTWDAEKQIGDLQQLSGYVDCTVTDPMHYFSVARESDLQEEQSKGDLANGYKTAIESDYAYKHAQLVELLPFFVRQDFNNEEDRKILCRCVHFLRNSPAFTKGNILLPYPMHLAKVLLDDLTCVVDA
jgi:hypothetical protein